MMERIEAFVRPSFESPYERRGIIAPGLPILPAGVERYVICGGGSQTVEVRAGDEISVLDRQGLQSGELVFFARDGRSDAAMLGAGGAGCPSQTIHILKDSPSGERVLAELSVKGIDISSGDAIRVFERESRAGDMETFISSHDGILIVSALGSPMEPHGHSFPTELFLYIKRANVQPRENSSKPPSPLADPKADLNVLPGQAVEYEVKAGEFIQILDVQGRECSDFQAFSVRALDKGLEREIDPTTTRSMTGLSCPQPGLLSKYWSVDQEPLVEIVQDTCGRHDVFNLACTARYYEDLGYPGHVNCSDNMNVRLANYGVRPRGGWPAINFFFNTSIDDTNAIGMDDPWSRPGDYVLLRALTDLLCVSTACPCDVDPANGWNPTDIQVRTYEKKEIFRRSIAFRKSTEAQMEETKPTGFHDCFARFTRNFVEYNGYWLAGDMTGAGAIEEYWNVRERVGVIDLSPLRKYEVTGPDAADLMQACLTRDISKLSVGQVVYSAMCYEHGGMIDDGTVFRMGDNNFRWVGGNDTSGLWLREQTEKMGLNAWVRDSTDQLCNIAVQGRHSREILNSIFWSDPTKPTVEELGWFRFTVARLGDVRGTACVISRTGYSGELGYEVFCHPKDAVEIFDAVMKAGEPFKIAPFGLDALDMLRIEAGLIFAGYEFSDQTDPFEAGIGFAVTLKSTSDDFIGRDALQQRKDHPQRKLVGLDIHGGVVPSSGDCVRVGKAQIGQITSATRSPFLGRVIALACLDTVHAKVGEEVEVGQLDGHQKRLSASVVKFPHFDPSKTRVKGEYS